MRNQFSTFGYVLIAAVGLATPSSQAQTVGGSTIPGQLPSDPTIYHVTNVGPHHRIWTRLSYDTLQSGHVITNTHSYTELTTGLNYWDSTTSQWLPSQEVIQSSPGGAIAQQGQFSVVFANDINTAGAIDMQMPDGRELKSDIVGLAYDDPVSGKSVLIAQTADSQGQLLGNNQVIYTNAFSGVNADVIYTYTRAGFEQDVVVRRQLPPPESFGLSSATAKLEILTEFLSPPQPAVTAISVNTGTGDTIQDQDLNFSSMHMARGNAFEIGDNSEGIPVSKQWVKLSGRQFLVEQVAFCAITNQLAQLPVAHAQLKLKTHSIGRLASKKWSLPKPRLAMADSHPMKMARMDSPNKGLVLDYNTLNSSLTNFTFQADGTYNIIGTVNIYGTNTYEGGTVIKYTNSASAKIVVNGPMVCVTGPYRPVMFTSMNDNSVGEPISGSSGNPANNTASYLVLNGAYDYTVSNFRFCYAGYGLTSSGAGAEVWDSQFVHCSYAVSQNSGMNFYNTLTAKCNYGFHFASAHSQSFLIENATIDVTNLWDYPPNILAGTNCIAVYVNNPYSSPNALNTYAVYLNPGGTIFQSCGGGNYYLATNSIYRNAGTTNINPLLLTDLAIKTTWPPLTNSKVNLTTNLTLPPYVQRDSDTPEIGYHYDALDYIFGGCVLSTNLTISNGVAIGWYEDTGSVNIGQPYAILLNNGANFAATGTATSPCWVARSLMVQEGCNGIWTANGYLGGLIFYGDGSAPAPLINCQFTKWSLPLAQGNDFRDDWKYGVAKLSNNEFYGGGVNSYWGPQYFTNCLFFRTAIAFWLSINAADFTIQNCTFYNGFLSMHRAAGQNTSFWTIENTAFDGTAIFTQGDNYNGNLTYTLFDYNAYNPNNSSWQTYPLGFTNTNKLEVAGAHDVIVSNGYNWQPSWLGNFYLPPNSSLVNTGSVTADLAGLYHFTTQTNQVKELNSIVDIGYHHVATDTNGVPIDTNGDGIPDYLEDANGNGAFDAGDLGDWLINPFSGLTRENGLMVFTPLKQ